VGGQRAHLLDHRGGDRLGLIPVGERDDHRVAGSAIDQRRDRRRSGPEHEISLPVPGDLAGVGLDRAGVDGDHVPDAPAAVGGHLAARATDRTLTAEAVKHPGVEHCS